MRYILLCLLLASCAGMPKAPDYVNVAVSTSCIEKMPEKPYFMSDGDLNKLAAPDYVLLLKAEYIRWRDWAGKLEAVLSGCK